MNINEYRLRTPMNEAEIRNLNAGDLVFLTGEAYEIRTASQYGKMMALSERNELPPFNIGGAAIFHSLASYDSHDNRLQFNYLGFVSSFITNKLMPAFLKKYGVRAVVGKGGMNAEVHQAMRERGCAYLSSISGCTGLYSSQVTSLKLHLPDWGIDRVLEYGLRDFGPLVVGMDAKGGSIYDEPLKAKLKALDSL